MGRLNINKQESGISLIEAVVALAILGTVSVIFFSGLATTSRIVQFSDQLSTAVSLAQMETETVKASPYVPEASQYTLLPLPDENDYIGFSTAIKVQPLRNPDDGIQRITVDVFNSGRLIYSLQSYKIER